MCLTYNEEFTNKISARLKKSPTKRIKCYKIYNFESGELRTESHGPVIIAKSGYIVSNRVNKDLSSQEKEYGVHYGIHAFLSKNAAIQYQKDSYDDRSFVVECFGHLNDFVAAGDYYGKNDNAVFMRVSINTKQKLRTPIEVEVIETKKIGLLDQLIRLQKSGNVVKND